MTTRHGPGATTRLVLAAVLLATPAARGQGAGAGPAPEQAPLLRLDGRGPMSFVSTLAFAPDGTALYQSGWDKVVRVWERDPRTGRVTPDGRSAYRTPIGPGVAGALNALAVSPDGAWLAVAGNAVVPGLAGFRDDGVIVPRPSMTEEMRLAQGAVYVFHTRQAPPRCRVLRGHRGEVYALAFAPGRDGRPPRLVSAGAEPSGADPGARDPLMALRLWDVETGAYLGGTTGPAVASFRPQLAAWAVGPGGDGLRVAAAWGAGSVLVWDAAPGPGQARRLGAAPAEAEGGRFVNTALAYDPGHSRLLTGHFPTGAAARLGPAAVRAWGGGDLSAVAAPAGPALAWDGPGADPAGALAVPLAMTPAASAPGGPKDLLAVVLRAVRKGQRPGEPFEHRLQLLDLGPAGPGRVRGGCPLWSGTIQPFVVASPDGRSLAVAGSAGDEVRVYSVADLLAGRDAPQSLRGEGDPVLGAGFVKRGGELGVLVSRARRPAPGAPPAPKPGDAVFAVANRRVVPYTPDWRAASPAPGGWQAAADRRDLMRVWVYRDGRPVGHVPLAPLNPANPPARVDLTDFALLPPNAAGRPPLVAAATDEPGVGPSLRLFDGSSGALVREFTGHAGPVRGLAFSEDGRLLLSASDDRTLCAWSLTDLGDVPGRTGGLPGVVLSTKGGACVVDRVEAGAAGGALRPGDVVRGIVRDARETGLSSAIDLYREFAGRRPGEVVILRLSRGGRVVDVAVTLGRSADERKPLLSLFLTRPDRDGARGWLAWTPTGPFDSSGGEVETLFGWHFNTGKADEPARFSRMAEGENPKLFRFEGLAARALALGRVPPRPAPAPRPLGLELEIEPKPLREGPDGLLVRTPPETLRLTLKDAVERAEEVESVAWRLDDGPERAMTSDAAGSWEADLKGLTWARGRHRLTAVARAKGAGAGAGTAAATRRVALVYVPPPPALTLLSPEGRPAEGAGDLVVKRPEFRLRARVEPAGGVPARLSVDCRNGAESLYHKGGDGAPIERPYELNETIRLKPGPNVIELVARNDRAVAPYEDMETRRVGPLVVTYTPEPVSPPSIRFAPLAELPRAPGAAGEGVPPGGGPDGPVASPRVRFSGRVEAREPLTEAQWWSDERRAWTRFDGFAPGRSPAFDFRREFLLSPGRNALKVRARAGESAWREALKDVEYRPPAPTVRAIEVDAPGRVVVHPRPGRVRLTARLDGASDQYPRRDDLCAVLVNGEPSGAPPVLDRAAGTLTATVDLKERENEIAVVVRNEWASESRSSVDVAYRRPPRVLDVRATEPKDRPFTDVEARVDSPLPLLGAEIEVDNPDAGEPVVRRDGVHVEKDGGAWVVKAEGVPLAKGESFVRVRAWNEDGDDRGPETGRSVVLRDAPPPAEVAILDPAPDARRTRPEVTVRFRVVSASPLTRLALVRERAGGGDQVVRQFDTDGAARSSDRGYEFEGEAVLTLERASNALKAVAVNAGGEAVARVNVTYVPPPVAVAIDRVEAREAPGAPLVPRLSAGGAVTFPEPADDGRVTLHGRLVWADEEARREGRGTRAQVWVNGFPQVTPPLAPRPNHPLEAEFHAEVLLSQPANAVEVRLVGAAAGDSVPPRFTLNCRKTYRDQMMHLLIVGVGSADEASLKARAIRALGGRMVDGSADRFQTPAFPQGRVYPPVCRDVSTAKVYGSLRRIRKNLPLGARASSDVVVIYYQGGESVEAGDLVLRLRPGDGRGEHDLLALGEIVRFFEGTRGAKLFLFDVTRSAAPPAPLAETGRWAQIGSEFGLLRFVWRDEPDLTRTDPPAEARLTTVVADALTRSTTLKEVDGEVARRADGLHRLYPTLFYDRVISSTMADLILGRSSPTASP